MYICQIYRKKKDYITEKHKFLRMFSIILHISCNIKYCHKLGSRHFMKDRCFKLKGHSNSE